MPTNDLQIEEAEQRESTAEEKEKFKSVGIFLSLIIHVRNAHHLGHEGTVLEDRQGRQRQSGREGGHLVHEGPDGRPLRGEYRLDI